MSAEYDTWGTGGHSKIASLISIAAAAIEEEQWRMAEPINLETWEPVNFKDRPPEYRNPKAQPAPWLQNKARAPPVKNR